MKDLADDRPLAFNFQQMEKVREGNTRHVIGVDACASRRTDDLNAHDSCRCVGRRAKALINPLEQDWNCAAGQLTVAVTLNMVACSLNAGFMMLLLACLQPSMYWFSTSVMAWYSCT